MDSGVCHHAFFEDQDGNSLILHHRYTLPGAQLSTNGSGEQTEALLELLSETDRDVRARRLARGDPTRGAPVPRRRFQPSVGVVANGPRPRSSGGEPDRAAAAEE